VKNKAGKTGGKSSILQAYERVYAFLKSCEPVVPDTLSVRNWNEETRADVLALVSKLPKPEKATDEDALCIFEEIRTGNLEWSFPLAFEGIRLGVFAAGAIRAHQMPLEVASSTCQGKPYWKHTYLSKRRL
jgi:hypothetical protein